MDKANLFNYEKCNKLNSKEAIFEEFKKILDRDIDALRNDKNDKKYDCLKFQHENIYTFFIVNNKSKKVTQDYEIKDVEHNPFQTVIIYLNEEAPFVAIEKNAAFGKDTDKLNDIFKNGLNNLQEIEDAPISVSSYILTQPDEFWNNVEFILNKYNDTLKEISFKVTHTKDSIATPSDRNEKMKDLINLFGCTRTESLTYSDFNEPFNTIKDNLIKLTQYISDSKDYQIATRFQKYGKLQYGTDCIIMYEIDNEITKLIKKQTDKTDTTDNKAEDKTDTTEYDTYKTIDDVFLALKSRLEEIIISIKNIDKANKPIINL